MIDRCSAPGLTPVIAVDKEKCVNCHACISACPVKYCNDGSGNHVTINPDLCIGCGSCLSHCTHEARGYIDDFGQFMKALACHESVIAIVAPSVAANFPGQYLNLNGWLKSTGVEAIFDVSFGAELTARSCLEHLKKNNPPAMISPACPAIVTYVELYQPALIEYLIPCDSPMVHTMKMIRQFYPSYADHKIAVVSPCMAKKREFVQAGLGDYNISYISIDRFLKSNDISLETFPEIEFDNPSGERAVLFSTPGGMLHTLERSFPDIRHKTRKIEGTPTVYEYMKTLSRSIGAGKNPLLIDCLNCELGCNGGTLTLAKKESNRDEIDFWLHHREEEMRARYGNTDKDGRTCSGTIGELISQYWRDGLYIRTYCDRSANVHIKIPDHDELSDIYRLMHKHSASDIYNCTACGYNSCENMAVAIFNKLNRPENCHFYLSRETELSHQKAVKTAKLLLAIFDTALEGLIQINKEGVIVAANTAINNMLSSEHVVGQSFSDYLEAGSRITFLQTSCLYTDNIQSTYEMDLVRSDGALLHCLISSTAIFDEEERLLGEFAIVSDITERKRMERKLQESEAKYRSIFDNATEGIFQCTPEGQLLTSNDALARILGYDSPKDLIEELSGHGEGHCIEFKEILKHHDISRPAEMHIRNKKGDNIWVSLNIRSICDETGNILLYEGTGSDITNRKRAEEELHKYRDHLEELVERRTAELKASNELLLKQIHEKELTALALRNSEEKYRNIFENSVEGIFQITPEGQLISVNPALARMHGFDSPDEMISAIRDIGNQLFVNRDEGLTLTKNAEKDGYIHGFETQMYRRDGSRLWVSINTRAVRDKNNKTVYYEGTIEDVTEHKHALEERTRLEAQLIQAQKMEAIGTLAGGVAHDFNNILTVITGYGTLLQMALEDTDSLRVYVDSILSAGEKAAGLTRSLLAFSRKQPITLIPLNINTCVKNTERLLRRLLTEDIDLITSLYPEEIVVMADAMQIDQILLNLSTNARDAMKKGGRLSIETERVNLDSVFFPYHGYCEPGEYALLSVSDNGCGIEESVIKKIFDPFFTTKEEGKGTGLGLSTVYGAVKQHNGYIAVQSEVNTGTTFSIYLPLVKMAARERADFAAAEIKGGNEVILIAEDNETARSILRDLLSQFGYSIVEAVDGEDAIRKYRENRVDLVIIDSVMPKKNGREAYDEIIKIDPSVKVIFTSGYTKDVVLDKGIEEGLVDFIPKPIIPGKLLDKVRKVLDR